MHHKGEWMRCWRPAQHKADTALQRSPRGVILRLSILLSLLATHSTVLADTKILFVTSNNSEIYTAFARDTINQLKKVSYDVLVSKVLTITEYLDRKVYDSIDDYSIAVICGDQAGQQFVNSSLRIPTVYTLIPRQSYDTLIAQQTREWQHGKTTAIYLDQPAEHQLRVIEAALQDNSELAVLGSASNWSEVEQLISLSAKYKLRINSQILSPGQDPVQELERLLDNSDALLALPDADIYSKANFQAILLMAYRFNKPLIGYSSAYVKAGATLAIYSTQAQFAKQTADVLNSIIKSGQKALPAPAYPSEYSIEYNRYVSKSLGLYLENNLKFQQLYNQHPPQ